MTSPSRDGECAESPFSDAITAMPANAIAIPTAFRQTGRFQFEKHRKNQRIDRPHADYHRRVADGGIPQSRREADLIHGDAEEAHVQKGPNIAKSKCAPRFPRRFRKCRQPRTNQIARDHHEASDDDAKCRQRQRGQRTQTNLRGDKIDGPNENDEPNRRTDGGAAGRSPAGGLNPHSVKPVVLCAR